MWGRCIWLKGPGIKPSGPPQHGRNPSSIGVTAPSNVLNSANIWYGPVLCINNCLPEAFLISKKRSHNWERFSSMTIKGTWWRSLATVSFNVEAAVSEAVWPLPGADTRLQSPSRDRTLLLCNPASSLTHSHSILSLERKQCYFKPNWGLCAVAAAAEVWEESLALANTPTGRALIMQDLFSRLKEAILY